MFKCLATLTVYFRDDYNRSDSELRDVEVLKAPSLSELYEEMARYKKENEYEYGKGSGYYGEVEFESIVQISAEFTLNSEVLENTTVWKEHQEKIRKAEEKKAKLAENNARMAAAALEVKERRTLEQLKRKYEGSH